MQNRKRKNPDPKTKTKTKTKNQKFTWEKSFIPSQPSQFSQEAIDEQKRHQEWIDIEERQRSFVQSYRDSHGGEIQKYILWADDKGFIPDPEWIQLYDNLEDARLAENAAYYNGIDPNKDSPYQNFVCSRLDFKDIKRRYEGSEAFTRYEKAYYELEKYKNLIKHYPGCPIDYSVIETNRFQNTTSMKDEKHKSVGYGNLFSPKDKQQNAAPTEKLLDTKRDKKPGL